MSESHTPMTLAHARRFVVIVLVAACSASARAADLDVSDLNDNDVGNKLLYRFAEDNGYQVKKAESGPNPAIVILTHNGSTIFIQTKLIKDGVDRLVAFVYFKGKQANVNSGVAALAIAKLSRSFNCCSFSIDGDGDIMLTYTLPFDNRLSARLFKMWCDHVVTTSNIIFDDQKDKALSGVIEK